MDAPRIAISCLMPTRGRHAMLPAAVANFLAQDYPDAELLIVSEDGIPDTLRPSLATGRVRHVPCPAGLSLGAKRNFACEAARGEFLAHWDDDDRYAHDRLSRQAHALRRQPTKALCGSSRVYFRELDGPLAWEYRYQGNRRPWLCGATLMYRRTFWREHRFRDESIGEDNYFVWSAHTAEALDLDDPALCIASVHAGNSSRKDTRNAWWTPIPRERIDAALTAPDRAAVAASAPRPRAVLVLAGGIGDVLRWASLVPVLDAAGYAVDLLLAADYPDCAALFEGALHVDRVRTADLANQSGLPADEPPPALAVFAYWAMSFAAQVPAVRQILANRQRWKLEGDPGCVAAIARELGWTDPLPLPPLAPAIRAGEASIEPGTLAIHAGCKAGWPWKKWHGYGELAQRFSRVLCVGTVSDEDSADTYFAKPIRWPDHVRDARSPRPLAESARMIARCSAMASNDSGLMHLAAALGVPTLGVFGLTSPAREAMPWPSLHTITGGLACEPTCRAEPWGRRDCKHHLECLKQLDPQSVAARLRDIAPILGQPSPEDRATTTVAAGSRLPRRAPEPLPLSIRLSGGFGDLLIAGRIIEIVWQLAGFGTVLTYSDRPELAMQALGGRGLVSTGRSLREWPAATGLRVEITQFVRFFDPPERWRATHPALADLIARAARRIESVRGLVDRHPHLDGFWARLNQAAKRRRGDSLAWAAGLDGETTDPILAHQAPRVRHEAPLTVSLDEADASPRQRLTASGVRWITVHDGFDTSAQARPGESVKCWPIGHWTELVRDLKAARPALHIVQIGGATSRPIPGVDECLLGRIRLGEALWLLDGAELHIDGESGLVHAAHALGTPAVVLFGPTDPDFFGYPGNTNLHSEDCAPCWWSTPDWMARCPRGLSEPACMAGIAPSRVLSAANALLDRNAQRPSHVAQVAHSAVWSSAPTAGTALIGAIKDFAELVVGSDGHAHGTATGCHMHATKFWEYAAALDALGITSAKTTERPLRIADLGCGRGALGPWLASRGHAVTGYDRDFAWDGSADAAPCFLGWAHGEGFDARAATVYAVPAPDQSFDAVLMISALQHLAHPALALREAARILRPGGRLILTFDLAETPERFEDPLLRRSIASPRRLAAWLGLAESDLGLTAVAIRQASIELQAAGIAGMPEGLTVGALCILKRS